MKHINDHPTNGIAEIHLALDKEFSWPKLETQSIIGFKEIVMLPRETPWDLDHKG